MRNKFATFLGCTVVAACIAVCAGCSANGQYLSGDSPGSKVIHNPGRAIPEFNNAVAMIGDLKFAAAQARLEAVLPTLQQAGDKNRSAEATFWIGFCLEKQNRPQAAVEEYRKVPQDYPGTLAARAASMRLEMLLAKG